MEVNTPGAAAPSTPAPANPASAAPATPAPPKVVLEAYSFRTIGFPYLRRALTVFGICLLLSSTVVAAARIMLARTVPVTEAAVQQQLAARDRVNAAETNIAQIRDYMARFEELRKQGFYGPESRLKMLEAIQAIQLERQLLPVEYVFAPQQTVAVDPALLPAPLALHATEVQLKMNLLHELDLVNLLQDLKQRGFFTAKACIVTREEGATARLSADCRLYWLSIDAPAPEADAQGEQS